MPSREAPLQLRRSILDASSDTPTSDVPVSGAEGRIRGAFAALQRDVPMAAKPVVAVAVAPAPAKTSDGTADAAAGTRPAPPAVVAMASESEPPASTPPAADPPRVRVGRSMTTAPAKVSGPPHEVAFRICSKFRSYKAHTGTYVAYDGKVRRCGPAVARAKAEPPPAPAPAAAPEKGGGLMDFLAKIGGGPAIGAPAPAAAPAN
jgi:hypothetical protein